MDQGVNCSCRIHIYCRTFKSYTAMLKKFVIFITAAALIGLFFFFGYRKAEQDFVTRQAESAEFQVRLKKNDLEPLTSEVSSAGVTDKAIKLEPNRIEPLVPKAKVKPVVKVSPQVMSAGSSSGTLTDESVVSGHPQVKGPIVQAQYVNAKVEVENIPSSYQAVINQQLTGKIYQNQSPLYKSTTISNNVTASAPKPEKKTQKQQLTVPVDDTKEPEYIPPTEMVESSANAAHAGLSQSFQIDNRLDTVLVGKYGTVIYIPRNCFTTASGTDNLSKVTLEIEEALYDLTTKLQRLQKASAEQTGFVDAAVFINAKANGKSLELKPGTQIYVELPSQLHLLGEANEKNIEDNAVSSLSNYHYDEDTSTDRSMIEMPLQTLNFNRYFNLCASNQSVAADLKAQQFEHTFIATREFEDRLRAIAKSCLYTHELVNLYVNNINKELWEVDFLAFNFIRDKYEANVSADRNSESLNAQNLINQFRFFYEQGYTSVKPINHYEFDVTAPGAYEKLIVRGYGPDQARDVVELATIREKLVQQASANPNTYTAAKYAFKVSNLGWVEANYRMPKQLNDGLDMQ